MGIPDYQTIMLPLLRFAGDSQVHSKHEAVEYLADEFDLTEEERRELLPSGKQGFFENQVGLSEGWTFTF
jgi:restriction system protein